MLLATLLACSGGGVSPVVPPARADETTRAPIDEWLPGTAWTCNAISSLGGTEYVVEHEWSFSETTWYSDIADRLAEEANSGYLPQFVGQAFFDWLSQNAGVWESRIDGAGGRHWFGVTDTTILLELTVSGASDATPTRMKIERYTASGGSTLAEFSIPSATATYAIDCAEDE